jgi:hypothetical protein
VAAIAAGAVAALPARAQLTIEDFSSTLGLGTADLKQSAINILQFVLTLMGLIAVTVIIYGGIVWMTAAGNEQRVDKAKKIITSAAIGLIVIILSWAIVIFVVGTTSNVTQ